MQHLLTPPSVVSANFFFSDDWTNLELESGSSYHVICGSVVVTLDITRRFYREGGKSGAYVK